MLRFAANLSLLYPDTPFRQRYASARADGFRGVEFLFPYEYDAGELARLLSDNGLEQVLFNAPPGDWAAGERGLASLPGRRDAFRASIDAALRYAERLACPQIHVMAGLVQAGVETERQQDTYLENLAWAAERAVEAGRLLLIEPINQRDMPGYFLRDQAQAHAVLQVIGRPGLKVQMDLYHCQITEGDVEMRLRQYLPGGNVGHLQIAGVPRRQEPDTGELNYPYVFDVLMELGYDGWIGCEYRPAADTSAGLVWLREARSNGFA